MKFRFEIETVIKNGHKKLHIIVTDNKGEHSFVTPMVFQGYNPVLDLPDGAYAMQENLSWATDGFEGCIEAFLQGALEAAWARGLRPKGYEEPAPAAVVNNTVIGADEAVRAHLEDLRKITFGLLEIES